MNIKSYHPHLDNEFRRFHSHPKLSNGEYAAMKQSRTHMAEKSGTKTCCKAAKPAAVFITVPEKKDMYSNVLNFLGSGKVILR